MLARPQTDRRAARLYEQCLLERELGILTGQRGWLEHAATSCRRLTTVHGSFERHDEALLVLAGLELRLGRAERAGDAASDVLQQHPTSGSRCAARLLAADARRARGQQRGPLSAGPTAAIAAAYRTVLQARECKGAARREERLQARYRLGWALVRGGRAVEGQLELRRLLVREKPSQRFAGRVLRDLAAIWSTQRPPQDAVDFLARQGGALFGAELAARVAEGLAGQGRLLDLLAFTQTALRRFRTPVAQRALWVQRLAGLATQGSEAQLRAAGYAVRAETTRSAAGAWSLRAAVAAALWRGAERLARAAQASDEPAAPTASVAQSLRAAERIHRLIATRFGGLDVAARARLRLAALATGARRWSEATRWLRAALPDARGDLRIELRYRLLAVLQRQAGELAGDRRNRAYESFLQSARAFVSEHGSDRRAPAVRLSLLDVLVDTRCWAAVGAAAADFLQAHPQDRAAARVRTQAIVAARALGQHERVHQLASALAADPRWAAIAAEAALARARELAGRGAREARVWLGRALRAARGETARRARLLAALLAAREADARTLDGLGTALLASAQGAERRRLQRLLAGWSAALGRFEQAAALELSGAHEEPQADERVVRQLSAAELLLDAGATARATALLRLVQRDLQSAGAPGQRQGQAMLRLGQLLERHAPRRAYGFYLQRSDALWRQRRRLAARLLLRAVPLAPSAARAEQLWRQAVELSGRLPAAGGAALAARARLALVQTWHRRGWAELGKGPSSLSGAERRLRALAGLYEPLLPVLALRDLRWSAAAGIQIAWVLERMAAVLASVRGAGSLQPALQRRRSTLLERRQTVLTSIGRLLRQKAGLNRHTLEAARSVAPPSSPLWLAADLLPTPTPAMAPALGALGRGRSRLAVRLVERALALHGVRPELLCLRAVALLRAQRPAAAVDDLRTALVASPSAPCARLNLATVALWRGARAEAKRLLGGLGARGLGARVRPRALGAELRRRAAALATRARTPAPARETL